MWIILNEKNYPPYLVGAVVLFFSLSITLLIELNQSEKQEQESHNQTLTYLSVLRTRLEGTFNSTIYLNRALSVLITEQAGITQRIFELIARELMASSQPIRNVALAEGYVIKRIYPLQGNQPAIGLGYSKTAAQWGAVKRAIDTQKTVVVGPVKLAQEVVALINRTPSSNPPSQTGQTRDNFWASPAL